MGGRIVSELVFWISVCTILYTYVGYLLLLRMVVRFKSKRVLKKDIEPMVSIIIAVYNGETEIRRKLDNILNLDYPEDKLEVIVASDCSTDKTDEIVNEYRDRGVRLFRLPERGGKTAAQNLAIAAVSGEVLVFSDVSTLIERKSFLALLSNFSDPEIGCVTSEDRHLSQEGGEGESAYVKYAIKLRRLESKLGSVMGMSGSFFAVRRSLAFQLPEGLPRDFLTPLTVRKEGFRAVNERKAVGLMTNVASARREYERKVRTIHRGLSGFFYMKKMMNPLRHGFFSLQLVSHKLLRWLMPVFLFLLMITSIILSPQGMIFRIVTVLHIVFFILVGLGLLNQRLGRSVKAFRIPLYFFLANLAVLHAWMRYLSGRKAATWKPSDR